MASDSSGEVEAQGIGEALDISKDGMMIESDEPIEATKLFIHASRNNGGSIKVEGFLVYSMPYSNGKYRSGLRFTGPSEQVTSFLTELENHPT
jgi:hypothetical protein